MQTVLMQQRVGQCMGRTFSSSSRTKPAAAAVVRQQQRQWQWQQHNAGGLLQQQQQRRQRAVIARVRIDDLENATQGQRAAAEALQAYMELEQSGQLNSVTAGNLR